MALKTIPTKARREPLTHTLVNTLAWNADVAKAQGHTIAGLHNCIEVPRVVGSFSYAAGAYGIDTGSSPAIKAITKNATGDVTIAFTSNFCPSRSRARVAIQGSATESKPCTWTTERVSANAVRVRLYQLSSALGAGNAWAAVDTGFALSVNGPPYADPGTARPFLLPVQSGNALGADAETIGRFTGNWNQYVDELGDMRAKLLVGHLAAGNHNLREVARGFGVAWWDGVSYAYGLHTVGKLAGTFVYSSVGQVQVDLTAAQFTAPFQVFPVVDYKRHTSPAESAVQLYCIGTSGQSNVKFAVNIYQYDFSAKTWARADSDFSFTIHGAPA